MEKDSKGYVIIPSKSKGELLAENIINVSKQKQAPSQEYYGKYVDLTGKAPKVYSPQKFTKAETKRFDKNLKAKEKEEQIRQAKIAAQIKKNRKRQYSLFYSAIRRNLAPQSQNRQQIISAREKYLRRQIELMKQRQKVLQIKSKLPPVAIKKPQPFFINPETNNDLYSAFNADDGHADGNIWGNEKYHDENDFVNEDFYTEDYFGDIGLDWGKIQRREGNPLFW